MTPKGNSPPLSLTPPFSEVDVLSAVTKNRARFPDDFMFRLSQEEWEVLFRSQNAILKTGRGQHRKYAPYAFTEHGALTQRLVGRFNADERLWFPIGAAPEAEPLQRFLPYRFCR